MYAKLTFMMSNLFYNGVFATSKLWSLSRFIRLTTDKCTRCVSIATENSDLTVYRIYLRHLLYVIINYDLQLATTDSTQLV